MKRTGIGNVTYQSFVRSFCRYGYCENEGDRMVELLVWHKGLWI